MSHDLRTPLNAISGFADLAAEGLYGPVTEEQRKVMVRIRRAGNHLLTLINDILSFAKIEAGRVQLHITDVPVSDIVMSAGVMIEVQAAKKGLSFGARSGADRVQVHADRERLTQVLTNLLTNAVKFTDAGSVTVGWRADDRAVRIDVRDTGRGIPATGWLPSSSRSCRPDAARRSSSRASGWGSPSAASWRARWEGI